MATAVQDAMFLFDNVDLDGACSMVVVDLIVQSVGIFDLVGSAIVGW